MTMMIRQLKPDEWPLYKEIRLRALQADPSVFGSSYAEEAADPDQKWIDLLANERFGIFMLFDGDKPFGITCIGYDWDDPHQKTGYLWGSWLDPEYRREGHSHDMYKARIDWALQRGDIDRIFVSHKESNSASKAANQKHGFVYTHKVPKIWRDGKEEDNIYYMLFLKSPWGQFPIETERLLLRPPVWHDAQAMGEAKRETWAQLQQWMAWAKGDGPDPDADRKSLLDQQKEHHDGEDCMLVGIEKASGRSVIFTGIHRPDWENRVFEIGFWTRASAQGKGYAQEVTKALTAHAFNQLNARRVVMAHASGNEASRAVIEKCGFAYTHSVDKEADALHQQSHWFEIRRPAP